MPNSDALYRGLFIFGFAVVILYGLATVALQPSGSLSMREIAAKLTQPVNEAVEPAPEAREQHEPDSSQVPAPARIMATPQPQDTSPVEPAPSSESILPAEESEPLTVEEKPADNAGMSANGLKRPGVVLKGLTSTIARDLVLSGGAVLVVELQDGREFYFTPGPNSGFADGEFLPWGPAVAEGYSNWQLALDRDTGAVPLPVIRMELMKAEGIVEIQNLALVFSSQLQNRLIEAQNAALAAVGLDYTSLSNNGHTVTTQGCWKEKEAPVHLTVVIVDGARQRVPGATPCP